MPLPFRLFCRNENKTRKSAPKRERLSSSSLTEKQDLDFPSTNILIGLQFVRGLNNGDVEGALSAAAANCILLFKNGDEVVEYTIQEYKDDMANCFRSFPNATFTYESIRETTPGVVVFGNWRGSGTHTGVPYSFGPYTAIPAKGVHVENDCESVTLHCSRGQLIKMEVEPLGPLSGPPGFYKQIGGLII